MKGDNKRGITWEGDNLRTWRQQPERRLLENTVQRLPNHKLLFCLFLTYRYWIMHKPKSCRLNTKEYTRICKNYHESYQGVQAPCTLSHKHQLSKPTWRTEVFLLDVDKACK